MTTVLTLDHIKRLRDLLLTKSEADLEQMHRCLSRQLGGIAHKIRDGDAKIAARMVSDAFPDVHVDSQILGGAYQREYPREYQREYQREYPREYRPYHPHMSEYRPASSGFFRTIGNNILNNILQSVIEVILWAVLTFVAVFGLACLATYGSEAGDDNSGGVADFMYKTFVAAFIFPLLDGSPRK